MSKKLLIFGNGEIASIAYNCFVKYTKYKIDGFIVDEFANNQKTFLDKKLINIKDIGNYPPKEYDIFIAISYRKLNRIREEKYNYFKNKKYDFANFIHPENHIDDNVKIGKNVFILQNQTIQNDVILGDNVMIWSSNHIGHGSIIGNHTYVSSHVTISGHCKIGERVFFGVNSCVADFCNIENDCFIGMSCSVGKNIKSGTYSVNKNTEFFEKDHKISKMIQKKYFQF